MDISSIIKGGFLLATLLLFGAFTYDQFFAPPKIHQGIILSKVFVPEHRAASQNVATYGRARTYKYIVHVQKYEQWVAVVKADDGDTLKVHCNSNHFKSTNVGDTLLFKEYKGEIFGIDYLAHSEEDTVKSDLRTLR